MPHLPDTNTTENPYLKLPFVTIDSESTRDIDDALYVEKLGNGYRVISANTGKEGLQYITSEHPDVILLDLGLPDMDGLEVLQKPVNNVSNNSTRFIIVTNQKIFKKNAKKISICFEVPHESGSLYHMLSHFIYNHLNLTKIESRPIEGRTWEYRFFLDFEGNLEDSAVKNALRGLREEASNMKILGNY